MDEWMDQRTVSPTRVPLLDHLHWAMCNQIQFQRNNDNYISIGFSIGSAIFWSDTLHCWTIQAQASYRTTLYRQDFDMIFRNGETNSLCDHGDDDKSDGNKRRYHITSAIVSLFGASAGPHRRRRYMGNRWSDHMISWCLVVLYSLLW